MLNRIFTIMKSETSDKYINKNYNDQLKSKNKDQRKRQLSTMMKENFEILKRINNVQPTIVAEKLEYERKEQEKIV